MDIRVFEDLWAAPFGRSFQREAWVPAVDLSETEDEMLLKADISRILPEDADNIPV
jgi:hypothetical protein